MNPQRLTLCLGLASCCGLLTQCAEVATKSPAEMRQIQSDSGFGESFFYVGSTHSYHYLWHNDYVGFFGTWHKYRVPRSQLPIEPNLEMPYNATLAGDSKKAIYSSISAEPPYLLSRHETSAEQNDRHIRESRDAAAAALLKRATPPPAKPEPAPLPPPPIPPPPPAS